MYRSHSSTFADAPADAAAERRTMTAAVLAAPGRCELVRAERPRPGPGQVLVRLEGTGLCASNLPPFEGRDWFDYPFAPGSPGHEGWGVVEEAGDAADAHLIGRRVAGLGYNAYATHDLMAVDQLVELPEALDGMPFPAEPLACALNVLDRSGIADGTRVAVVGVGFLGALLVDLAVRRGAQVVALSRRASSLELAGRLGARACVSLQGDHAAAVHEGLDAAADCVIETTGHQEGLDAADRLVGVRGRLVIAGYHQDGPRRIDLQSWNWRGIDVINAHERDPAIYLRGMRRAVEAAASGSLDPRPLFTHVFPLAEVQRAFETARARPEGFIKALILNGRGEEGR